MNESCSSQGPCAHWEDARAEARSADPCPQKWIYNNILEFIDVGTLVLDAETEQVVYQNRAAAEILRELGLPRHFLALRDLFAPIAQPGDGAGKGPGTIRSGNRLIGYSVYVISASLWCVFLRDVTEKKRLESIAEAVNTMDNIGYIFSGIRHEIGNPVNSLKMTMSVLKRNLESFSGETVAEYVDRSLAEISRMEYLLKSLKTFSMFEAPELRRVDLQGFMEQFTALLTRDFERAGIRITLRAGREPLAARTDPRALQQVLLNLLANAKGALVDRTSPEIVLSTAGRDGLAWITVEDNGCGISEQEQKHLFKPFYTTKAEGTGLGLVITRKMLAQMNSNIEVFSQPGVGTTVILSLPALG